MDRYSATGREHNGCDRCDGMGCYPLRPKDISSYEEQRLYDAATPHVIKVPFMQRVRNKLRGVRPMSKWRFVKCPDCPKAGGTP